MADVVQQQVLPAPFIEAAAKPYLQELTSAVGDYKGQDLSKIFGSQFIAGQDRLQEEAQKLAESGIGGYQKFLDAAMASTGPTGYKQFMSPYQLQAQLLQQGFTQANQLAQQNMMNQLGLGSAQQGFLGQDVGALSTLGAQNQALAQAQLSAQQQLAQQQANQKLQAAQTLGAGITGLISGYPGQTTTQSSPSPTLAQTALGTGATLAGIYRGFGLGKD